MSAQEALSRGLRSLAHEGEPGACGEHAATQAAVQAEDALEFGDAGAGGPAAPDADVHVRVQQRLGRLANLHRQMAQVLESLSRDVQNQLAVPREPRHMERVPEAEANTVETKNADPKKSAPRVLLGEPELAELLAVDVATIRRWRRAGELPPAVEIGGTLRWRADAIDAWLKSREVQP